MLSRLAHSKNPHFANIIVNGRVSDSKLEAIVVAQRALTEKLADLTRKFSVCHFGLQVCCQPRLFVRASRHFQPRRKQVPQALPELRSICQARVNQRVRTRAQGRRRMRARRARDARSQRSALRAPLHSQPALRLGTVTMRIGCGVLACACVFELLWPTASTALVDLGRSEVRERGCAVAWHRVWASPLRSVA